METIPGKGLVPLGRKPGYSRLAIAGLIVSGIGVAAAILAGYGTREGWWDFRQGFRILYAAACAGAAGAALSIGGAVAARPGRERRGFVAALLGAVLGLVAFGVPANWYEISRQFPRIHDVTTDTENPPQFQAILPLRKDAPNTAQYGGPEVAARQHAAYPDIRPLALDIPPDQAFRIALGAARRMKWRIVADEEASGRIEAVATTRWFGFKDDVVVRVTSSAAGGSVVDVRSVSRVGISDVGTNARRIRSFLETVAGAAKNPTRHD